MAIKAKQMTRTSGGKGKAPALVPRKFWSISHWVDYDLCPFMYACRRVWKFTEPAGPDFIRRGIELHEEASKFLDGKTKVIHKELTGIEKLLREAKKLKFLSEQKWAFTAQYKPTEFFAPNAWLRVITDAHRNDPKKFDITTVDYKTGTHKDWHDAQGNIYAVASFIMAPKARTATIKFWYIDHPDLNSKVVYRRPQFEAMRKDWDREANRMLNDLVCAPTPNPKCKWCAFAKSRGGQCRFDG